MGDAVVNGCVLGLGRLEREREADPMIRLMRPDPKVYSHGALCPALDPCRVDTSAVLRAESGKFKMSEFKS